MYGEHIVWLDEYCIGVPEIDSDHQELFRIVKRLYMANQQPDRTQWAAEEGIKYLKIYTQRHFQKEENFMREIQYKDIERHTMQHSIMRTKVIPRIESHLRHTKFSQEAMEKFLEIMRVWLNRHILIHDRAMGWASKSPADL